MVTDIREVELKYEASPEAVLPPLEDLPRVAREAGHDEETLGAEYYDTEDLRLLRAGVTLRRRRGGPDAGWHLKLPAGPQTRREIELPLGRTGRTVPAELASLVRVYTRGEVLRPVAQVDTVRRRRTLLDDAGTSLAEVVADEVSAQTLGESTTISRWREVEVELTGGDRQLLRAADRRLRRGGLRPAGRMAKLERAFADQLPADGQRPSLGRHSSSAEVIMAYVRDQADALKALDPMVRRNEPDSVHQMRVASRRLRSTLQSFGSILRPADTAHLRDELRWLGHVLGGARDAEVLAERLETEVKQAPAELVMGPVQARLREHFAPLEARTRQAVLEALDSKRYVGLLDELDRLLADPPLGPAASHPAQDGVPGNVARTYRRTARRIRRAKRAPNGQARNVALHGARRAAKRARYAAEAASPVYGKPARRFAKRMKNVQSVLGTHQDAVIARDTIREIGVRAHLEGENAFTFGLLHERETAAARDSESQARKEWKRASRRKYRAWL
ncbi:MAG TPA: CYTH and CHAD domain-containing protein [Streptosporangiaceae bacterium]|nr:CYTH and CHAD domain-containing protein [Streptosporangiaceae bacterium]